MQDHPLLTLHWRSFSEWGRERLSTCFLYKGCEYIRKWQCHTLVNILQFTVGYKNASTNRKIWNSEPEIGTGGASQTRLNRLVDGSGSRFGPPRATGLGFWTALQLNQHIFTVQTRTSGGLPWSVANTIRMILLPSPNTVHQWSINNFWCWMLNNQRVVQWRYPIIILSPTILGNNGSDNIVTASSTWALMQRPQFVYGLTKLYSNEVHCIVPILSF